MKILLTILLLASVANADSNVWTYFHPEAVRTYGCKVTEADFIKDERGSESRWVARAYATRSNEQDWAKDLAAFPPTESGLRKAMKECENWQIKAHKLVETAQKPLLKGK